ncbi:MAG: OpgC domain-containing protein, partial [Xanthobacteraceae bacterium]
MALPRVERDLRLDLFRGIALWLIFLDHIPSNIVSWITIRNYGFSDATEIFVF